MLIIVDDNNEDYKGKEDRSFVVLGQIDWRMNAAVDLCTYYFVKLRATHLLSKSTIVYTNNIIFIRHHH